MRRVLKWLILGWTAFIASLVVASMASVVRVRETSSDSRMPARATSSAQRRASALALAVVGVLVLGGCPGEVALDEEREVRLVLHTPELDGAVELSDEDATALGVDQSVWEIDEGPSYGHVVIPTGLTHTASQRPEYCFAEPVLIAPEAGPERTLVQAGECFEGTTVMNRVDVKFASPSPGDVVGNNLEVQVIDKVGDPDSDVRFFVDGELASSDIDRDGRAPLDLAGVDAGSVGVRVEVVAPSGRVLAASVIELVKQGA